MQQIKDIVKGPYEPQDNTVIWIDTSNPDAPIAKVHSNGEWKTTIGGEKATEIGSDSTDEEIPTAKAVNDRITALADEVGVDLDKYKEYFTIEATEDETTVYFRQSLYAANDGLDPLKVEVSTDDGATWTEITAAPAEDDVPGATLASLDAGEKIIIRGNNSAYGYLSESEGEAVENCNFWADAQCYVYGNIMSLVSKIGFEHLRSVGEYAFTFFFSAYDSNLDHSWVLSKDGAELLLPATTLAKRCYNNMFYHCSSLATAPELPATTLVSGCYSEMFQGCSNLSYIKALFTTTPSNTYTRNWVSNVSSTGTFVKFASASWDVTGNNGVPNGWTIKEQNPAQRDDQADWEETNSSRASYIWNKPETHVLRVQGSANNFEETIEMVLLDDRVITFQRLKKLTPLNTVITHGTSLLSLNLVEVYEEDNLIYLEGGVISDSFGKVVAIFINFSPDELAGTVTIHEV